LVGEVLLDVGEAEVLDETADDRLGVGVVAGDEIASRSSSGLVGGLSRPVA
jgi:hypothetical protein